MTRTFIFIILLRALSALIITNSHYNNIYPLEIIANGGLLGDVLFFAISGFCLTPPRQKFVQWYRRRIIRIYCPVWIITTFYLLCDAYSVSTWGDIVKLFCFPTYYHFVGSIILLYIPFYFICAHGLSAKKYMAISCSLFALQLILYFTVYDKSYYHIDNVREPMIWFLFLQSMLLGAYFREQDYVGSKKYNGMILFLLICFIILYFISKLLFVKYSHISVYQLINQMILWIVLYFIFRIFMPFENSFKNMSPRLLAIARFLADHTLEIYLVQYVIIVKLNYGPFPINWLIVSSAIIVSAMILRYISQFILRRFTPNA